MSLSALQNAIEPNKSEEGGSTPPVPKSLEDTGISRTIFEHLILKYLYFRGELVGREMSNLIGLSFSLIDDILETLKHQHFITVKKSLGMGNISGLFALTEAGRAIARECLETNQYAGPAPVPLEQYREIVRSQRPKENWLSHEALTGAFSHLVVNEDILEQIGPAVNASESFLMYGKPGNGKTALAEALVRIETAPIFIPYALESQGNIIQVYDPIYHRKIEDQASVVSALSVEPPYDGRWFKGHRPFIITGGELTLDALDLSYNQHSKIYDAPFQVKANNGIYLIDDFGRQKATPAEILNRWIVPMERHLDYLNFQTGGKVTVPFEAFVIFSTNLQPDHLGDEAFLRRIQYKMYLPSPNSAEFLQIFKRVCEFRAIPCTPGLAENFIQKHYIGKDKRFRRCHARDVISHAIAILNYHHRPLELSEQVLDRAFHSCFVEHQDVND